MASEKKIKKRPVADFDLPPPNYDPGTGMLTLCTYVGGRVNEDETEYEGGHAYKFDYMPYDLLDFAALARLAEREKMGKDAKMYIKQHERFKHVRGDVELLDICLEHLDISKQVTVYISGTVEDDGEVEDCDYEDNGDDNGEVNGDDNGDAELLDYCLEHLSESEDSEDGDYDGVGFSDWSFDDKEYYHHIDGDVEDLGGLVCSLKADAAVAGMDVDETGGTNWFEWKSGSVGDQVTLEQAEEVGVGGQDVGDIPDKEGGFEAEEVGAGIGGQDVGDIPDKASGFGAEEVGAGVGGQDVGDIPDKEGGFEAEEVGAGVGGQDVGDIPDKEGGFEAEEVGAGVGGQDVGDIPDKASGFGAEEIGAGGQDVGDIPDKEGGDDTYSIGNPDKYVGDDTYPDQTTFGGQRDDETDEYLQNLYEYNIDMAAGAFDEDTSSKDSYQYDASSEDSEFDLGKGDCENIDDDDEMYDCFIDRDVSEAEVPTEQGDIGDDVVAEQGGVDGETDVNPSDDNYHSGKDSDSEIDRSKIPLFNSAAVLNPNFKLGMLFCNKDEIRQAVHSHAIRTKRNIRITRNDKMRLVAKCLGKDCDWRMHSVKLKDQETYKIREYVEKHTCNESFHIKNLKSSWLCKQYGHMFKTDPKRKASGFQADVMEDLSINVTKNQAYKAKYRSVAMLEGDSSQQYAMLWSYAEEIKRSNPGSTVLIGTDQSSGGNVFDRMYVCFKALKVGFLAGCRRLVGVDGCHLKGPHGGILLTAVGLDPNNNIYPIAYAVVGSENGANWEWFLNLLKIDLEIENDSDWTFMSDKQKGLIQAFQALLPNADHRFCVRHMHSNMKLAGFNGQAYKIAVWRAAKACTVNEFDRRMEEVKKLDQKAFDWLADKPPHQWSKAHFRCVCKSDMLLNNLCETFNSNILEARDKPILSMMEWLHEYLMKRTSECRDRSKKKWKAQEGPCPRIQHIIQENIGKMSTCVPLKADDNHYQIKCSDGSMFAVDLENKSCGCRKWDLTGIPCKHAVRAITCQGWDVQDYISNYYKVARYNMVYQPVIMPINGRSEWPKTDFLAPTPPTFGRSAGRPKKTRRREPDEIVTKKRKRNRVRVPINPNKTRRQQTSIHCSVCGVEGHNKRYCTLTKEPAASGDGGESSKVQASKAKNKGKKMLQASQGQTNGEEDLSQLTQTQPSQMKTPPTMWDQLQEQQGRNEQLSKTKKFINPNNVKSVLSELRGKGKRMGKGKAPFV